MDTRDSRPCLSEADLAAALRRCESEPIHQIGLIQPHGALVALDDGPARTVLHASANLSEFFAADPASIVGKPFADLVGHDQAADLERLFFGRRNGPRSSSLIYSVVNDRVLELQASTHRCNDRILIEFEPTQTKIETQNIAELFSRIRHGLWLLDETDGIESYCHAAAAFVRDVTGFERVMIYRFDTNWEGEVIAESRSASVSSYLGNRFPAGDIPPQARALYARNPLRLVADIEAEPVPLVPPVDSASGAPLDLSFSALRAFSPIHVEYLRNMGVRASASLSIMQQGKLWGLIACHHSQPLRVGHTVREMLEFIAKVVSMKLAGVEADQIIFQGNRLSKTMISVIKHLAASGFDEAALSRHGGEIIDLVGAGGALMIVEGRRYCFGDVPGEPQVDELLGWLGSRPEDEYFATDHLEAQFPQAAGYAALGAGCLVTPVSQDMRNAFIWFRPEKLRTIQWAGRPEKLIEMDALNELRISPRKSFAAWTDIWRHRSTPWRSDEVVSGALLAEVLLDILRQRRPAARDAA